MADPISTILTGAAGQLLAEGVKNLPRLLGGRVDPSVPIPDLEFSKNNDLAPSKSYTSAFGLIMDALKDNKISRIGVWGLGGVGKTTLVTQVGYTAKSLQLFPNPIMLVVSQTPDFGKLQERIAESLSLKFQRTTQKGKAEELRLRLKEEKKLLIVLDDMWEELNLEDVGIPLDGNRNGCKIILTTRNRRVCESMSQVTVPLGLMDEEEAWDLFKRNANLDNDAAIDIIEVAKEVAKECGGLPIAIVALARALKSNKDLNGWKLAHLKLEKSRLTDIENIPKEEDKNAYLSLEASYNYLGSEATKRCFLLCSLYPEDFRIHVEDLVNYAWGLRLYQNANSIQEVRREVAAAIGNLLDCGLLLKADEFSFRNEFSIYREFSFKDERRLDWIRFIKLHDVVRDVARWIAFKEDNGFLTKPGVESAENECSKQKLQILLHHQYDSQIQSECFETMQELKVLYARKLTKNFFSLKVDFFSLNALESLTNLRTLQLKNFKQLKGISVIAKLTKLEILRLNGVEFQESVEDLGELKNLRLLDFRHCNFVLGFPSNLIQRLIKLEDLYLYPSTIPTSDVGTVILPELNMLTRLTSRSISLSLAIPSLDFSEDFVFPKLERYNIAINTYCDSEDGPILSRSLCISGGLPIKVISELHWNVEFLGVSNIDKEDVKCLIDATTAGNVPVATFLQNLREMWIHNCKHLQVIFRTMDEDSQKQLLLSKLKVLHLQFLWNLELLWRMPTQHISLQSLEVVTISHCGELKSVFSFALGQGMVRLERLEIVWCSKLKQIVEEAEGNESSPISLPKLRYLVIDSCGSLEYVFPNLMVLPQLEKIELSDLPLLKQISNRERVREKVGIWLPRLQHFELESCPNFSDVISPISESANSEVFRFLFSSAICIKEINLIK